MRKWFIGLGFALLAVVILGLSFRNEDTLLGLIDFACDEIVPVGSRLVYGDNNRIGIGYGKFSCSSDCFEALQDKAHMKPEEDHFFRIPIFQPSRDKWWDYENDRAYGVSKDHPGYKGKISGSDGHDYVILADYIEPMLYLYIQRIK